MKYNVLVKKRVDGALRGLRQIDAHTYQEVIQTLQRISDDPNIGVRLSGPLRGKFAARAGDYRVVYEVEHSKIIVLAISRREKTYQSYAS